MGMHDNKCWWEGEKKNNLILYQKGRGYNVHLAFWMLVGFVYLSKQDVYGRKRNYYSVRKWSIGNAMILCLVIGQVEEKEKFPEEEFVI